MVISIKTKGFNDVIDITGRIEEVVRSSKIEEGLVNIFVTGSTASLTLLEYEPGVVADLKTALEKIAPMEGEYAHEQAWHDDNGYADIRAALLKASLSVPIKDRRMILGMWQQIVLIDFDNKARSREVNVTIIANKLH